ncbi:MAG: AMP-binding protein [Deltaproteobacteria bacterium]|nr:AMP-binding protein [Deltaproteobacteria bacterium]
MSDVIWRPSAEYLKDSNIKRLMDLAGVDNYPDLHAWSVADTSRFWDTALKDLGVEWYEPYHTTQANGFPFADWFIGGKTNIVLNCIDRHVRDGRGDHLAFTHECDDRDATAFTYDHLNREVCRLANALRARGVKKGDGIGIYMPMAPEIIVVFFAILKVGAVAIPVFSGFGASALAVRMEDANVKLLFTSDGSYRRGKPVPIKDEADRACEQASCIETVVVLKRTGEVVPFDEDRDVWYEEFVEGHEEHAETEVCDAEDTALIIYTSGTTGKPKGTVHTHAGCLAQMAKELGYAFDVKPDSRFFWVTDIGWMMGPWEFIGVQFFGASYLIFEGVPNYPDPGRLWQIVEKHKLTHLGVSPTAIRLLMSADVSFVEKYDTSSLRFFGSTGEPWDPESYMWLFEKVGKSKVPIINISGGTEIVGCHLSPNPATPLKISTLAGPGLGMDVDCFDEDGNSVKKGIGHLVCKQPAPSMTKGFLGDRQRYLDTYFSKFDNIWFHGDWAEIDEDGFWFLRGRSDDTIKVAGKRTGPAEVESAVMEHGKVLESAAIGVPDDLKGETVGIFVVLRPGVEESEELRKEISGTVVHHLGKTLKPEFVKFVDDLPKTRSAKILRGTIKKIHLGKDPGDTASCANPDALEGIKSAR